MLRLVFTLSVPYVFHSSGIYCTCNPASYMQTNWSWTQNYNRVPHPIGHRKYISACVTFLLKIWRYESSGPPNQPTQVNPCIHLGKLLLTIVFIWFSDLECPWETAVSESNTVVSSVASHCKHSASGFWKWYCPKSFGEYATFRLQNGFPVVSWKMASESLLVAGLKKVCANAKLSKKKKTWLLVNFTSNMKIGWGL